MAVGHRRDPRQGLHRQRRRADGGQAQAALRSRRGTRSSSPRASAAAWTSTPSRSIAGRPAAELRDALEEAVREGLLLRRGGAYRFLHDRVQQAAYSLIPAGQLAEVHLRIGRLLLKAQRAEERDEALFDVVGHLNRGAALLRSQAERDELAALNLRAGRKAKAAAAFQSAAALFAAGLSLLAPDSLGDAARADLRPDLRARARRVHHRRLRRGRAAPRRAHGAREDPARDGRRRRARRRAERHPRAIRPRGGDRALVAPRLRHRSAAPPHRRTDRRGDRAASGRPWATGRSRT